MVRLAVVAAMSCLAWAVPAAASSPPSIDSESVTGITSTDATREAAGDAWMMNFS
jgi:hypothetical protein